MHSQQRNELYVNEVWPGDSVFPSFTNQVRSWWADKRNFGVMGVRGVWNDMNEPASFKVADDVQFADEDDTAILHKDAYTSMVCMAMATKDGWLKI